MIRFYDTFPSHLFVEMCYGRENNFGFIYEQKLSHRDLNYLCEAYGVFNGCYELASELFNIGNQKTFGETFLYNPKNVDFINTIDVTVDFSPNSGFSPTESKFINGKFKPLKLYIGFNTTDNKTISAIMHELLHAYEDYKRRNDKAITLDKKAINIGYYKNRKRQNLEEFSYRISNILYFLTDFERNAYITQMYGLLCACDKKFYKISDVLDYIKSTIPYKNYQTVFRWVEDLCNINDRYMQKHILDVVNKRSEHNFKTFGQVTKWMVNKMLKYEKKFNNIIPKMAAKYLDMVETFNAPTDYLIDT